MLRSFLPFGLCFREIDFSIFFIYCCFLMKWDKYFALRHLKISKFPSKFNFSSSMWILTLSYKLVKVKNWLLKKPYSNFEKGQLVNFHIQCFNSKYVIIFYFQIVKNYYTFRNRVSTFQRFFVPCFFKVNDILHHLEAY